MAHLVSHLVVVRLSGLRWEVSVDGHTRPRVDWLCTRERAVEHALEMADDLVGRFGREVVRVVVDAPGGTDRLVFSPDARAAGWAST